MSEEITTKLDQLANFLAERDVLALEKKELIDQILTPEIRARLEEVEVEFAGKVEAVQENITALEEEIRADVLRQGASVKASFLRVIWHKGRVTWDTKSLDSYAESHPEVAGFRRQGDPFVSITKV
jgi:hypothetical protein